MKIKAAWKYGIVLLGIALTAAATFWLFKSKPNCLASRGQIVVKWKDMYWVHCKYSWNGYCLWPIRRKHSTYKVAVQEGIPVRDEKGMPIATAGGKIRNWTVYDSVAWNRLENRPSEKNRFLDYEPIAENEYVVLVETRYRLFHNVEATLRMCTQKP